MIDVTSLKATILRRENSDTLRRKFIERTHETMCAQIGYGRMPRDRAKWAATNAPHLLVWAGYEELTNKGDY